ncbi:MAG TPA: cation-transporting P-type ATPase [Candidatus Acidoferrum sp.]|nr:cation-transporting P-type ATPase [Candidatus Acidoferrum sp.]
MQGSDKESKGLSEAEAEKRLLEVGPNQLAKPYTISFLGIAKEEVVEPMILLLLVVGVLYTIIEWPSVEDAVTIFAVIFVLVFVEISNEWRAKKSISALSVLAAPKTRVVRDDRIIEIETEKVVPGDLLVFTEGTRIAADCKLTLSYDIQVDESVLTGESLPKEKKAGDEVYAGTLVLSGEGQGEAYATGKNSRFGKISAMAQAIKPPKTPLQLSMKKLSITLAYVAMFFAIVIPALGIIHYGILHGFQSSKALSTDSQLVLTGLALAFAAIPEELPIIITMILGLGSYRLSQKGFLVKKLKAAETLGDATVILTDKTGTITENKMQVVQVYPRKQEARTLSAATGALTEMSLAPTDKAILERAQTLKVKTDYGNVIHERGFQPGKRTKTVLRENKGSYTLSVIGAPEEILSSQGNDDVFGEELKSEAEKGRRIIGVAQKTVSAAEAILPLSELEGNWDFIGLISLEDPPRPGVKETIAAISKAGIRTIMVTGDHPQTAAYIAQSVGIPSEKVFTGEELHGLGDKEMQDIVKDVSVYARTTPEDKYRLVQALHANGEVVAVTGDGVNDVLALKGADVGIAMGTRGTDAAKEAADVVLTDDNFVTIGHGVFEGRTFFDNLRKGLKYYLAIKAALISLFVAALALEYFYNANMPLPFAPIQIIVLELFMDLAASAGFVTEPAEKTIYDRKPREIGAKFPDRKMNIDMAINAASLFVAVMLAYFYAWLQGLSPITVQAYAFSAWIMGHIILAFVMRSEKEPLSVLGPLSNKIMDLWAVLAFAFLIVALTIPPITSQLKLASIGPEQFIIILAFDLVAIIWQEIAKYILYKRNPKP